VHVERISEIEPGKHGVARLEAEAGLIGQLDCDGSALNAHHAGHCRTEDAPVLIIRGLADLIALVDRERAALSTSGTASLGRAMTSGPFAAASRPSAMASCRRGSCVRFAMRWSRPRLAARSAVTTDYARHRLTHRVVEIFCNHATSRQENAAALAPPTMLARRAVMLSYGP